ncbi:hypothetical protein SAMN05421776_10811 [Nocardia farcinica]|uniref:Uncharacterized protein n=1 Tax=Nocardia farcinica TaxID=37329 RepID=A0A0H5PB65_NOCFR|nr:hypothetical protein [Nocardia farcinica]AXK88646.1 hypothetical protein DXT66_26195 [Nocardia farcinica]CRY84509.1 Uncharacterised protein [Nocardia farcinica]SIT28980.1 hypothetical protein SAMN05421776_10811 [Nocardia farcinica]
MLLTFLGKGGSSDRDCPTLYATDRGTYLVQGWITDTAGVVEIPHLLPGFAEHDTYIGATMTDTGRGTFTLSGRPITDAETLGQLTLAADETAIEVPKLERTFYGAAVDRRRSR